MTEMRLPQNWNPGDIVMPRGIAPTGLAELAFLRAVMRGISEAVCVTDLDNRLLFVNDKFRELYGYSDSELVGRSIALVVSPRVSAATLEEVRAATSRGMAWKGELWDIKKDGTEFPIRLATAPVLDQHGKTIALVGVATDITAEKQAEEARSLQFDSLLRIHQVGVQLAALPSSADLYGYLAASLRSLTGALGVTVGEYRPAHRDIVLRRLDLDPSALELAGKIVGTDPAGIVTPVDDRAYQMALATPVSVRSSLLDVMIFGGVSPQAVALVQQMLDIRKAVSLAYVVEGTLYGTSLLAFAEGTPLPPMILLEAFVSLAAVSLRRYQAEQNLLQSNERLRSIANNVPGLLFQFYARKNGERGLNYISESTQALLGVPIGSLYGLFESLTARIVPEDREGFFASVEAAIRERRAWEFEGRYNKPTGQVLWLRGTAQPRVVDDGLVFDGMVLDITEQRKAEAERRRLEEQLQQAHKMESIGRLAGGVAHDFNNLLTVINGYSELLLADLGPSDPRFSTLEQINKAGERAAALTNQLLAFSRKQVMQLRPLSLDLVVRDMQPMLVRLVGEDVEVRLTLNAPATVVHADPHQIEQVVLNLVANARDAMPRGGILAIETSEAGSEALLSPPSPEASRYVVLAVSDNGVGMDEPTRLRAFEPFFTTKGVGKGTGLGLSMVQGIVAQSGGTIEVDSYPGHGTTFRIYLPAIEEAVPVEDPGHPDAAPAVPGKETVLVVEDSEDVRSFVAAALRVHGYQIETAENADDAVLLCEHRRTPVDLLVTDVVMPGMSGRELAERLRERTPGLRVLFMSGYTDDVVVLHGPLDEGTGFIQKPFSPDQLAAEVRLILARPDRPAITS